MKTRLSFASTVTLCASISAFFGVPASHAAEPTYPHQDARAAAAEFGFDATAPGCAWFMACTDSHVAFPKSPEFPRYVIDDANAMSPSPAFLAITGDMICSASLSFGHRPNAAQKKTAIKEFEALRDGLQQLKPGIPVRFAPGNHDTYPGEVDLALLRSVFPEAKPYSTEVLAGVHLFFLNGASSGDLDEKQQEWLGGKAGQLLPEAQAILFVHQPALGSVVNERGIGAAVSRAFADHRGLMWLLAGHVHSNRDSVFQLANTTIVQTSMATCSPHYWGGSQKPGYWIYCLDNGVVKGRIYRRHPHGYRTMALPDRSRPRPIPVPFSGLTPVIRTIFVGQGDREFLRTARAADVTTWWGYIKDLSYAFPSTLFETPPARLAVLASLSHNHKDPKRQGHLFLSPDGETWQEVSLSSPSKGSYVISLPADIQAADAIHVRITGSGNLGGFAFLGKAL
ncbi:MAG: hypothetical protein HN742_34450 [Lentisphaerae bacterium]|jgi:hypothetical protein|nr:hypothetical protein [Lentisphaerota bacterium]MBT5605060.1 hypothetical protein [Lentisphaerota bacterium]MBT7058682.1 hypothetical protein [Lentisphaerota bacterium]MBT7847023.1 hypothetical protein [Lentisphaerota bacterium]